MEGVILDYNMSQSSSNLPGGLKPKACGSECGSPALPGGKLWEEGEGEFQI